MALADNQRSYYKMEDVNDATSNAYNLTNTGSVSFATAGKIGNSAGKFNGTNQRLGRSDAMGFTTTSVNTWSAFVKFNTMGGYVFDFTTTSGGNRRAIIYCSTDKLVLYCNSTDNVINTGTSSITTGVWYHIILTHNSGSYELFLDNVSKGTATPSGTGGASNYFSIGNAGDSFGAPVDGWIDEVGVWDRVIDSTNRSELYNSGAGSQYPYSVSVTVNATVLSATTSIQAPSISGGSLVSPNVLTATFSVQSATELIDQFFTPAQPITATFSIPVVNIITPDAQILATVLTATFSIPTAMPSGGASVDATVQSVTFSIPTVSFIGSVTISPDAQVATFSTPAPTISAVGNVTVSATAVAATFSLQSPTVTAEQNAMFNAGVLSATFSIQTPTITATRNITIDASVISATFSIPTPLRKVGGLWTAQPRAQGVWTPQPRAI